MGNSPLHISVSPVGISPHGDFTPTLKSVCCRDFTTWGIHPYTFLCTMWGFPPVVKTTHYALLSVGVKTPGGKPHMWGSAHCGEILGGIYPQRGEIPPARSWHGYCLRRCKCLISLRNFGGYTIFGNRGLESLLSTLTIFLNGSIPLAP